MKYFTVLLVALTVAFPAIASIAPERPPVFVTAEQIRYLKENPERFKEIKKKCDSQVKRVPSPIADFSPPMHYEDMKGEAVFNKAISGDGAAAYQEALCYRVTGDTKYAKASEGLIDAWALGVQKITSRAQGAYDFIFNFYTFIIAADLLRADSGWDNSAFVAFLKDKVLPACEWTLSSKNNIGNWAVLHWTASGAYLNDEEMVQRARKRWEELLDSEVVADGSMLLEICRTNTMKSCEGPDKGVNGLTYTHWALYPAVLAAEIFRNRGIDVYGTQSGRELKLAYEKAAAWAVNPSTFPYYMSNKGLINHYGVTSYMAVLQARMPSTNAVEVLKNKDVKGDTLELMTLYPQGAQK